MRKVFVGLVFWMGLATLVAASDRGPRLPDYPAEEVAAGVYVTPDLGETVLADPQLVRLHGGVRSDEDLRWLVDVNAARGVDVIKTRATERAGLPDPPVI